MNKNPYQYSLKLILNKRNRAFLSHFEKQYSSCYSTVFCIAYILGTSGKTPYYHYNDVIMSIMASQITSLMTVYSDSDQRKHQSSRSVAFVRGIRRWPVNSRHKGPLTWKMFPFDAVIMTLYDSKSNTIKITLGPTNEFSNSNSMEISFSCNSILGYHITTKFCTYQESTAVVPW